jgi:hypothetical protein
MGIGNILGGIFSVAKHVGESLPGVGSVVKQGEDTLGQIGKAGDSLLGREENTPSSYNTQEANGQQGQSVNGSIGNLMIPRALSKEGESTANAAKAAASDISAAKDIAAMLV